MPYFNSCLPSRMKIMEEKFCPVTVDPLWKGYMVQRRKQDVTTVVLICKNGDET